MKTVFVLLVSLCLPAQAMADPLDVYGVWLTAAKDGYVEIRDCGDGTPCGTLVWIAPTGIDRELDARNRDPSLRQRKLLGTPIVWGFKQTPKNWQRGAIYNPADGKSFAASLERRDYDRLKVSGCLGPLCRTNIWNRVDALPAEGD
jgi:uncharacterized protein (DUF2147 family)